MPYERIFWSSSVVALCHLVLAASSSILASDSLVEDFVNPKLPPRNIFLCSDNLAQHLPPVEKIIDSLLDGQGFKLLNNSDRPDEDSYLLYIGHPPSSASEISCLSSAQTDLIDLVIAEAAKPRPVANPAFLPPGMPPLQIHSAGFDVPTKVGSTARIQFCYIEGNPCGSEVTLSAFNIDDTICEVWNCKILEPYLSVDQGR